jgi:hypothetical protein
MRLVAWIRFIGLLGLIKNPSLAHFGTGGTFQFAQIVWGKNIVAHLTGADLVTE